MKCYKLNYLYPWWCTNFKSQFPIDHVETIAEGLKEIYGGDLWEEIEFKNLQWKNEQEIWAVGTHSALPQYIKMQKGNGIYYYNLYDRNEIVSESNEGLMYRGKYLLDSYMTKYQRKLQCLINENPVVKFNHKYCDRFQKDSNDNWTIDFVAQKYLSSFIAQNSEKVRKLAYSTTEEELWNNNFSQYTKPATRTLTNYANATQTWEISDFNTILSTPSNTGRYRYMVCKSSAKVSTNNDKIQPTVTTQTILVIPIWNDGVLHAINDINTTGTQTGALSCLGENLIGFWESDLPYSFLYGMEQTDSTNIKMYYAQNQCFGVTEGKIPFWEIPLNYYSKYKIIDYSQYSQGFGGKMTYMIQHLDKWNPETEPALYAPQNYQEVYNNGVGNITNDLSYFIYKWTSASLENLKRYEIDGTIPNDDPSFISMYACFGFDDALNIAYDFGEFTNRKLASYDNTEVITSSVSIANQIAGSAAANYYSGNVNTGLTSVQNRASEQKQAHIDASLNTAKNAINSVPSGIGDLLNPGRTAKRAAVNAIDTAKTWIDMDMEQQRKNREIHSQINNIYSSPATIVGSPYIKGIIPNNNYLFKTYALELHDYDKKKIFGDILEFGRIYDTLDKFNAFNNNLYMNILDITPRTTYYKLLRIVLENDNSIFNTQADNDEFFIWLGQPHQMFNVWFPINCLNYEGDDYIDNVEKINYPSLKAHINTIITNIPARLRAEKSLCLQDLKDANPSAPEGVWSDIEIIRADYNYVSIKTKDTSTNYYGSIIKPCCCYNAIVELGSGTQYVYNFNKVFTANSNSGIISEKDVYKFENGKTVSAVEFNAPITFNTLSSITSIETGFLGQFPFPFEHIQNIPIPKFNSNIVLPTNLTKIGIIMLNARYMTSTIEVNSNPSEMSIALLPFVSTSANAPSYTTGITISGTYATQFKEQLPNLDGSNYFRKLV